MIRVLNRKRARRRPKSAMAVFLALLCLTGQLSTSAHLLLVRHATCPEHGELIDTTGRGLRGPSTPRSVAAAGERATAATAGGTTTGGAASARLGATAVAAAPGLPAGHGHDHCAFLSHQRQQFALHAQQRVVDAPLLPPPIRVPVATRPAFATTLFLLAPKNSPPA